jgi:Spy/CpxP family protein refolding chaperone
MKKTSALNSALRNAGAKVAHEEPATQAAPATVAESGAWRTQPSRAGTKPITLHLSEETRDQLKILAAEQRRTVADLGVEAFNLLFARHRKPEIASTKGSPKHK